MCVYSLHTLSLKFTQSVSIFKTASCPEKHSKQPKTETVFFVYLLQDFGFTSLSLWFGFLKSMKIQIMKRMSTMRSKYEERFSLPKQSETATFNTPCCVCLYVADTKVKRKTNNVEWGSFSMHFSRQNNFQFQLKCLFCFFFPTNMRYSIYFLIY